MKASLILVTLLALALGGCDEVGDSGSDSDSFQESRADAALSPDSSFCDNLGDLQLLTPYDYLPTPCLYGNSSMIVPFQGGYGGTCRPEAITAYTLRPEVHPRGCLPDAMMPNCIRIWCCHEVPVACAQLY